MSNINDFNDLIFSTYTRCRPKTELVPHQTSREYVEKLNIIIEIFPDKDWKRIMKFFKPGLLDRGSRYDLDTLLTEYFNPDEKSLINSKINTPSAIGINTRILPIDMVHRIPNDQFNDYAISGDKVFKIPRPRHSNPVVGGALKVIRVRKNYYMQLNSSSKFDSTKSYKILKFFKTNNSFDYVLQILDKIDFENHRRCTSILDENAQYIKENKKEAIEQLAKGALFHRKS